MTLQKLKETFTKKIAPAALAATIAAMPAAHADDSNYDASATATAATTYNAAANTNASAPKSTHATYTAAHAAKDMLRYSTDADIQGIGIFINLQENAMGMGDDFGKKLIDGFAKLNEYADYRINQSRGTTTDVVFYLRGVPYEVNITDLQDKMPEIVKMQRGAWLPERSASQATDQKAPVIKPER